jgi:hypothetical protein
MVGVRKTGTALRCGLLLAVLVLAGACGGRGDGPGPAPVPPAVPTGATAAPDPLTATPPAGGTALPPTQVDASAVPPGQPTLVWTRGGGTLGLYGRAGGCTTARAEIVDQTAERVGLRIVRSTTGPGPCTRELRYPPLEVTLDAALGSRRVVLSGVTA